MRTALQITGSVMIGFAAGLSTMIMASGIGMSDDKVVILGPFIACLVSGGIYLVCDSLRVK